MIENLDLFTDDEVMTLRKQGILGFKCDDLFEWYLKNRAEKFDCDATEFIGSFTDGQMNYLVKTEMGEYVVLDEDQYFKITNLIIYFRDDEPPFDKLVEMAKTDPKGWASTFIDSVVKKGIMTNYFELGDVLEVNDFMALKEDYVSNFGKGVLDSNTPRNIADFIDEWIRTNIPDSPDINDAFPADDE